MACSLRVKVVVFAVVLANTVLTARMDEDMESRDAWNLSARTKILEGFRRLRGLIKSRKEPRGSPFPPLVSKPQKSERVAIVGAGLAGLHMAYLLKKKGYNDVVVLEKDCRVGGKVMSVNHDGFVYEMGACYTSPDYITNVYALAKELGVSEFIPASPTSTVWLDNIIQPMLFKKYVMMDIMRLTSAKNPAQAARNLIDATFRYVVLHRGMFGKYEGDLMLKPSRQVLSKLNKTMLLFLTEHNLLALVPVLTGALTIQGYGHLDRVSALYGMMWNTPNFITGMLARSVGMGNGGADMFRNGFMQLTDKLAAMVDVRLDIDIENIRRESSAITITFNEGLTEDFDFLIWAADAREALKVLEHPTAMEITFSRLTNTWLTTTLVDSTEKCRDPTPISYWLSNVYHKREHSVWVRRNRKFVMTGERCDGTKKSMSTVVYQMGDTSPLGTCQVQRKFQQYFQGLRAQHVNVVKRKSWNYFPRFSVKEMADGVLWDIAEHQGERSTWFVGSSVVFESTKSVIEYNKLMIARMML